jgi:prepilin-type N-terminal cleavage/methylation domain-containing protein
MKLVPRYIRGFTLIEMLVVMGIMAILALIISMSFSTTKQKARDSRRISDLNQVRVALEQYRSTYKFYPEPDGGAPEKGYCGLVKQLAQYLSVVPLDPSNVGTGCNATSPYYYEYYTANFVTPQEAMLRTRTLEIPAAMRGTLLSDVDGDVSPTNAAQKWFGGAKNGEAQYCTNASGGCATINCGTASSDTIYCLRVD